MLRERGNEYGATTGRPRRVGWLDLVALKHAVQINGVDSLFLTKLDVLDELAEIQVATAYEIDGGRSDRFPCHADALDRVAPGLPDPARLADKHSAPSAACRTCRKQVRSYLDFIEEFTGAASATSRSAASGSRRSRSAVRSGRLLGQIDYSIEAAKNICKKSLWQVMESGKFLAGESAVNRYTWSWPSWLGFGFCLGLDLGFGLGFGLGESRPCSCA